MSIDALAAGISDTKTRARRFIAILPRSHNGSIKIVTLEHFGDVRPHDKASLSCMRIKYLTNLPRHVALHLFEAQA